MPKRQNVPESVKEAIRGRLKDPQLAEVAAHFFANAGGPRAVAKMLYEEFVTAKQGSVVRQRILDMILRVTRFANEKNAPRDDLGMLSEDDLQREFQAAMAEMPEVSDARPAEAAADVPGPEPAIHDCDPTGADATHDPGRPASPAADDSASPS